jgi:hypothetical protein
VPFSIESCGAAGTLSPASELLPARPKRKYHRTQKSLGPRTYRTRPDPFAADWTDITEWLAHQPERTAKSIFQELQQRSPGQYPDIQLRTLQRRVKDWRATAILAFEVQWLDEEMLGSRPIAGSAGALIAIAATEGTEQYAEW